MRSTALAAAIGAIAAGACAGRTPSPTFASPASLSAPRTSDPMPPEDPPAAPIRVVSAAAIRAVSAAEEPPCGVDHAGLRAPHRGAQPPPPPLRTPFDLRTLVGRRDPRAPLAAVAAWSRELGAPLAAATGAEVVSWATEARRLRPALETPLPGDLLVFHQATSDDPADLVALVIDRDARGVTEFVYVASGIVRRGLVDASRPAVHRDARGETVNTYLRHGKRWPAKGSHYLAGELLGHVIRTR